MRKKPFGRTIEIEEINRTNGATLTRRRVEIWQRAATEKTDEFTTTRRVFAERDRLVAGE